jgi:hypothetical protein
LDGLTVASTAPADGNPHYSAVRAIEGKSTGKWYFEFQVLQVTNILPFGDTMIAGLAGFRYDNVRGIGGQNFSVPTTDVITGTAVDARGRWKGDGLGSAYATAIGQNFAAGMTVGIAVDVDARLVWARANLGPWNNNGSADPASGTGGQPLDPVGTLSDGYLGPVVWPAGSVGWPGDAIKFCFGATDFVGSPPTGFTGWTETYATQGSLLYDAGTTNGYAGIIRVGSFVPAARMSLQSINYGLASTVGIASPVIYDSDGPGGAPGTLIASGPAVAAKDAPGGQYAFAGSHILYPNFVYYVGIVSDDDWGGLNGTLSALAYSSAAGVVPGSPPATFPSPSFSLPGAAFEVIAALPTPPPPGIRPDYQLPTGQPVQLICVPPCEVTLDCNTWAGRIFNGRRR